MNDWPFFNCPKCKALYHVVKVAPGRRIVEGKVRCRLCGEPLPRTLTVNETNGQQLIYNNITGNVAGDTVTVASDNNGGTDVNWGTAPAMTTQYWISGTAGDWSMAADWLSGVVPSSTDDAVISSSVGVTVNGTAVANLLTLDGSILTLSGMLTLGTSLIVDDGAQLQLNGGTLSAQSVSSNSNGSLSGYGTVGGAVSGDVDITAAGGTLTVQGSLAADQGRLDIGSGATLELGNGAPVGAVIYFGGSPATLKLDAPTAFTGAIEDIVVGDEIDLAGITASSATYSGTTLAVNETNGQQLIYNNITGNVAGDTVTVASDNNGGTDVNWVPSPTVSAVTATTDNGARDLDAGHVVTITVDTSDIVTVTGTPTLQLNDNEVATYRTGTGTSTLTFTYTVQPGDNIADLQVTGLNLPLGATVQDGAGNSLSGSVTGDLGIQIDTTPPSPATIISVTDNVAPVTGPLANGAYTNDPDPTVQVSLSGTGALAGHTVQLYNGRGTGSPPLF